MKNLRAEVYVLGAILLEKQAIIKVIDILKPEHFSDLRHRIIYKELLTIFEGGKPIDYFILIQELKTKKLLDDITPGYIVSLPKQLGSASHIIQHSRYIVEAYMKKRLLNYTIKLNELINESSLDEILEFAGNELSNIDNIIQSSETVSIEETLIEALNENQNDFKKYNTGYDTLDEVLKIRQSQLIIIAARPSHGKTALALNIAYNISKKHKVGIFSLEMSRQELGFRLVSRAGNIPHDFFDNKLVGDRLNRVNETIYKLSNENKIKINDTAGISIAKLRAKVLEMKLKDNVELIVIDYLQLMDGKGESQNVKIGNISTGLKRIAKEFNIPIIVLSQLSRGIENRANKRPKLSDLRDSGSLEQDADIVLFLRNYYKDNELFRIDDKGEEFSIEKGYCDIYCEKQRGGQTFEIPIYFDMRTQTFLDKYYFEKIEDLPDINEF